MLVAVLVAEPVATFFATLAAPLAAPLVDDPGAPLTGTLSVIGISVGAAGSPLNQFSVSVSAANRRSG